MSWSISSDCAQTRDLAEEIDSCPARIYALLCCFPPPQFWWERKSHFRDDGHSISCWGHCLSYLDPYFNWCDALKTLSIEVKCLARPICSLRLSQQNHAPPLHALCNEALSFEDICVQNPPSWVWKSSWLKPHFARLRKSLLRLRALNSLAPVTFLDECRRGTGSHGNSF